MGIGSKILKEVLEELLTKPPIENPRPRISRITVEPIRALAGKPVPGTPVYCNLAVEFEHTGICIGDDKIVHLNGDGKIEIVSPRQFVARLDGLNPAISIYCASRNGKALGNASIAARARSMVNRRRNYHFLFDNCHQFTCGCLSGDFENPCNFFWMVEAEISDKLGSFTWAEWNY